MSDVNYMVVFRGDLVDDVDPEQVKESLQQLFELTAEKVERLFTLSAVVLKKNISHELAHNLTQQLEKIGVLTEVKAMDEAKLIALGAHSHDGSRTATDAAEDRGKRQQFEFHGNGAEYFKIWIVNVFLSILTLGIFSAWAKVRNHRYFYGNTRLDGAGFEYTANPVAILKGRVVAVGFLLLFNYASTALPLGGILYGALVLLFIVAFPWLINRSMAFRNYNTVYRNLRFGFDGDYLDAFKAFVLWPLAGALSFGLLMPYAVFRQKHYIVDCSRYGCSSFNADFVWRDIYGVAVRASLLMVLAIVLAVVPLIGPLLALVGYLFAFAYFSANIGNTVYNGARLHAHGFDSTLQTGSLAMVYLTNWLMIALTLGLAMPWAKVRLAHYRAEHLALLADGPLDEFITAEEERVGTLGEEIGEAFDLDIGL